jgi:hypothetical protein
MSEVKLEVKALCIGIGIAESVVQMKAIKKMHNEKIGNNARSRTCVCICVCLSQRGRERKRVSERKTHTEGRERERGC